MFTLSRSSSDVMQISNRLCKHQFPCNNREVGERNSASNEDACVREEASRGNALRESLPLVRMQSVRLRILLILPSDESCNICLEPSPPRSRDHAQRSSQSPSRQRRSECYDRITIGRDESLLPKLL